MDISPEQLLKAKELIQKSAQRLFEKNKIDLNQLQAALSIPTTTNYEGVANADLVIEAATEVPDLKVQIIF